AIELVAALHDDFEHDDATTALAELRERVRGSPDEIDVLVRLGQRIAKDYNQQFAIEPLTAAHELARGERRIETGIALAEALRDADRRDEAAGMLGELVALADERARRPGASEADVDVAITAYFLQAPLGDDVALLRTAHELATTVAQRRR